MASITVKKYDGTTDIVFDALAGAPGDGGDAIWRQDTGAASGLPVGYRATFRLKSKDNGKGTARQLVWSFVQPYAVQDTTTSLYQSKDSVVASGIITLPKGIPSSNLNETVQVLNLLASALVKSSVAAGYAPT
jgi:hypothetical protein